MSHFVETMAYVGDRPWHGLGQDLQEEDAKDIGKTLVAAGLDWGVEKVETFHKVEGEEGSEFRLVPGGYVTRRLSDGKVLGVVGNYYEVLQNLDAFEWFAPFLEAGEARFESAGSLKGGTIIWVLAKLNRERMLIGKDEVEKYLMLSHAHDGSQHIRLGYTPVRVVCWNTLQMAKGDENSMLIRIRHTKGAAEAMANVREVVDIANQDFEATAQEYRKLIDRRIHHEDVAKYVRLVLDVDPKAEESTLSTRIKNILTKITDLFSSGKGNKGETLWDAYNGVTEWLSHERGKEGEKRMTSLWFGDGAKLGRKALRIALEMAQEKG
jgi:phage/plasmid-like protein (TIGR03299 family)